MAKTSRIASLILAIIAVLAAGANAISDTSAAQAIYVANYLGNCITVYDPESAGDQAPKATIEGPATDLSWPISVAVDAAGRVFVLNEGPKGQNSGYTLIFSPGSAGNSPPLATVQARGVFLSPKAIAVNHRGILYVAYTGGSVGATISRPGGIAIYSTAGGPPRPG
jgi:hypothetical protein